MRCRRAEIAKLSVLIFLLTLGASCSSLSRVQLSKEEVIELRLVGEPGTAYYGTFVYEKLSPFNQFKSASSSFTSDMNSKVETLPMNLKREIPSSIFFRKEGGNAYFYKFDTTRVPVPFKIRVFNNNVFKREIEIRQDDVMKYAVVNFG